MSNAKPIAAIAQISHWIGVRRWLIRSLAAALSAAGFGLVRGC
jgi:hypothetical protein